MTRRAIAVAALSAGLALGLVQLGCSPTAPPPEDTAVGARVEVVFAAGRVAFAHGVRIDAWTPTPDLAVDATDLSWEYAGAASGAVLARGHAPDTRVVHYDSMGDDTAMDLDQLRAESAILTAEIPNVAGSLRIFEPDGRFIGELAFRPLREPEVSADGWVPGGADIDFATDVIGSPVLLHGDGNPAKHFNLLFVPEGYRRSELARFRTDVNNLIAGMRPVPVYRESFTSLNMWVQDIQSADSGISEPGRRELDTAFNISLGNGTDRPRRCAMPSSNWEAISVSSMLRLRGTVRADIVVIVANTTAYAACARPGELVVLSASTGGRVLAHELGHALFLLGDEYEEAGRRCASNGPNIWNDLATLPWRDLISSGTRVPTPTSVPANTIGAFEGAGYCSRGMYRPQQSCLMRTNEADFCAVCARQARARFEHRRTLVNHVTITNMTPTDAWFLCDGPWGRPGCTGWTKVVPGASAEMDLVEGRFRMTQGSSTYLLTAPSAAFSVYANEADPLTPPRDVDASMSMPDAGVAPSDAGRSDAGADAGGAPRDAGSTGCTLASIVVNELQTGGSTAGDEFVELFNPCDAGVSLDGATLNYRSATATGPADTVLLATLRGSIAARGYFVIGSATYAGAVDQRPLASGLSAAGGGVGVRAPDRALVDSVGWGTARNPFVETRAASSAPDRQSISRRPNGADSGNNATDFATAMPPTPGASN